jgi:hypothetical protein
MGLRFQAILLSIVLWGTAASALDIAKLPYRIGADGRVSTDVFLNGQGPFNFVLDTASSRTMLFEHLRQELKLVPADTGMLKVYAMNNIGTAVPVKPGALGLDTQTINGLTMGVLPDDVTPVDGQQSADGILGMDALSHYFLVMDHDTLQVKLMDPSDPGATAYREWPSERLTPYQAHDMDITFWWMQAKFGGENVTALLDMGSGITMLNWEAAERLGLHRVDFLKSKVPQDLRDALGTLEPVVLGERPFHPGGRSQISRSNGDRGERQSVPIFRPCGPARRHHRPRFVALELAGDRFRQAADLYRSHHTSSGARRAFLSGR